MFGNKELKKRIELLEQKLQELQKLKTDYDKAIHSIGFLQECLALSVSNCQNVFRKCIIAKIGAICEGTVQYHYPMTCWTIDIDSSIVEHETMIEILIELRKKYPNYKFKLQEDKIEITKSQDIQISGNNQNSSDIEPSSTPELDLS